LLGDDSEKLTGLVVCFIGVGEIVGSFSSGALSKIGILRRGPIAAFGLILEMFSYLIILLMIPNHTPKEEVYHIAFIYPNKVVMLYTICAEI